MIGGRPDGTKELIAVEDGYRESWESWADLLRDLKRGGMRAPVLAIGDGALGFWAAVRDVWPETRRATRLGPSDGERARTSCPSGSGQPKAALREMMYAATRGEAEEQIAVFAADYGGQLSYGRRLAHTRSGEAAHFLRLPSRTLETHPDHKCRGVDLRAGISHVLVNTGTVDCFRDRGTDVDSGLDWKRFRAFDERCLEAVFSSPGFVLYETC